MSIDISIIIPIYNVELYFVACIESVIKQKGCIIEIILIDDCSTDNSYQIAKEYANKHKNIQLIRQPTNQKVSAARNKGIDLAQGKYILFVDSDDYLKPNSICHLLKEAEKYDLDILFSTYFKIKDDSYITTQFLFPDKVLTGIEYMNAVKFLDILVWNKLWKKSFLKKQFIRFHNYGFEDVVFVANAIRKAKKIKGINYPFYYYRIREGSTMTQKISLDMLISQNKMYTALEKLYLKNKTNISAHQYLKLFFYASASFSRMLSQFKPVIKQEKQLKKDFQIKLKRKHSLYRKLIFKCSKLGFIQKIALFISPQLLQFLFDLKLKIGHKI